MKSLRSKAEIVSSVNAQLRFLNALSQSIIAIERLSSEASSVPFATVDSGITLMIRGASKEQQNILNVLHGMLLLDRDEKREQKESQNAE